MPRGGYVDRAKYDRMVAAFRSCPGNARQAEKISGIDRRSCHKGWLQGWSEKGLPPIRTAIEEEQTLARARLAKLREEETRSMVQEQAGRDEMDRARAAEDAIKSRAEEAAMVRGSRRVAISLMASVQRLLRGANELAKRLETDLTKDKEIKPTQAIALFQAIASTTRATNEAARLAQQMERSLLGQPDKWVGLHVTMTTAEALREIELAERAARRFREDNSIPTLGTGVDDQPLDDPPLDADVLLIADAH